MPTFAPAEHKPEPEPEKPPEPPTPNTLVFPNATVSQSEPPALTDAQRAEVRREIASVLKSLASLADQLWHEAEADEREATP